MRRLFVICTLALLLTGCILAPDGTPITLSSAGEIYVTGYTRGIYDTCVAMLSTGSEYLSGGADKQARYMIHQQCQQLAQDAHDRARARMWLHENGQAQPKETPQLSMRQM